MSLMRMHAEPIAVGNEENGRMIGCRRGKHRLNKRLSESPPRSSLEVYRAVLSALAGLVETRDPEAGDHLGRIRAYCKHLTDHMDLRAAAPNAPRRFAKLVIEASTLHDIGKATIPDHILLKRDRLTATEFRYIRRHASAGYRTLMRTVRAVGPHPFLQVAADITHAHHERWDGSGYPRRLAGKGIPLSARIVAV